MFVNYNYNNRTTWLYTAIQVQCCFFFSVSFFYMDHQLLRRSFMAEASSLLPSVLACYHESIYHTYFLLQDPYFKMSQLEWLKSQPEQCFQPTNGANISIIRKQLQLTKSGGDSWILSQQQWWPAAVVPTFASLCLKLTTHFFNMTKYFECSILSLLPCQLHMCHMGTESLTGIETVKETGISKQSFWVNNQTTAG